MTPKDLWESQEDYQAFSVDDFQEHIYQERRKQLAGPYWQQKRNKTAMKEREKKVDEMCHKWIQNKWEEDMNDITSQFQRI